MIRLLTTFSLFLFPCLSLFVTPTIASFHSNLTLYSNAYTPLIIAVSMGVSLAVFMLFLDLCLFKTPQKTFRLMALSLWSVIFCFFFLKHLSWANRYPNAGDGLSIFVSFIFGSYLVKWIGIKQLERFIFVLSVVFLTADIIQLKKITQREMPPTVVANNERDRPPSILHLMFDKFSFEHAANDNPAFIKSIKRLTQKHNLTFYPQHFANHSHTNSAVPDFLRPDKTSSIVKGFNEKTENTLFHHFYKKGYSLFIYGHYLPYCLRFAHLTKHCQTDSRRSREWVSQSKLLIELYLSEFSRSLHDMFLNKTSFRIWNRYAQNSIEMIDDFLEDSSLWLQNKTPFYVYLHVLIPHDPFRLSADCEITPTSLIGHPQISKLKPLQDQSLCALKQLDRILSTIAQKNKSPLKIVIHSDHGILLDSIDLTRKSQLSNKNIMELSHVPAWTKSFNQTRSTFFNELTSNDSISNFLIDNRARIRPSQSITFNCPFALKTPFHSKDGISWDNSFSNPFPLAPNIH